MHHPLARQAGRLPWTQIETALAPHFARWVCQGRAVAQDGVSGPLIPIAGTGVAFRRVAAGCAFNDVSNKKTWEMPSRGDHCKRDSPQFCQGSICYVNFIELIAYPLILEKR